MANRSWLLPAFILISCGSQDTKIGNNLEYLRSPPIRERVEVPERGCLKYYAYVSPPGRRCVVWAEWDLCSRYTDITRNGHFDRNKDLGLVLNQYSWHSFFECLGPGYENLLERL